MKNKTKIITFGVIPLIFILLAVYDVFALMKGGTEASISSLIITTSYKMPFMGYMIGFINGVLVGHLMWRMRPNQDTKVIDSSDFMKGL